MHTTSYIGEDTKVEVHFDYTPPEPEIRYPNDRAQPGYPAEIIINQVLLKKDDLFDDLNETVLTRLEQDCWEYVKDDGSE